MRRTPPWLMLLFALASGGVAAALALRYLRQQTSPLIAPASGKSGIVVAAHPLAPGVVVAPADVKLLEWSGNTTPLGFMRSPGDAVGRAVLVPMAENEPFFEGKLAPKGGGGGLQTMIGDGMRAVSVRVDEVVGVAGFVLPNTRVDVLLTMARQSGADNSEPASRVILQNIRTLASGQSVQQDRDGKPQTVTVITLLVTPEQAETLALASNEGRIQLALRNVLDSVDVETRGTRVSALFGGAPRVTVVRSPSVPRPTAEAPPGTVIEVYKGGVRSLQKF